MSDPVEHQAGDLLDWQETADYFNTTTRHVRAMQERREIPYHKIGGRVRFLRSDLDAYRDARRVDAR